MTDNLDKAHFSNCMFTGEIKANHNVTIRIPANAKSACIVTQGDDIFIDVTNPILERPVNFGRSTTRMVAREPSSELDLPSTSRNLYLFNGGRCAMISVIFIIDGEL